MPLKPEARAEGMRDGVRWSNASSLSSRFGLPGNPARRSEADEFPGTTVGDRRYSVGTTVGDRRCRDLVAARPCDQEGTSVHFLECESRPTLSSPRQSCEAIS
jgi:hypothetical protein